MLYFQVHSSWLVYLTFVMGTSNTKIYISKYFSLVKLLFCVDGVTPEVV